MRHTTLENKKKLIKDLNSTSQIFKEFSYMNNILPKIKEKNRELTTKCYNIDLLNDSDINLLKIIIKKIKEQSQTIKLTLSSEILPVFNLVEDCISEARKKRESYCFTLKQAQMINYCCKSLHIDIKFVVMFDSQENLNISKYLTNDSEVRKYVEKDLKIDYIEIKPIKKRS